VVKPVSVKIVATISRGKEPKVVGTDQVKQVRKLIRTYRSTTENLCWA